MPTDRYPLSRKYLPYRRFFLVFILITMLFGGGMVPYFLIARSGSWTISSPLSFPPCERIQHFAHENF
ncbi:MAG: hypothetical protein ACLRTQ_06285 [Candidatus Borkfalkia sp.]